MSRGNKRRWASQNVTESCEDIFLSQDRPGRNSQASLSQCSTRSSSFRETRSKNSQSMHKSYDMQQQEEMQLINAVIRYLLVADRSKQPIQKSHIVKNALVGNTKEYRSIMEGVTRQLSKVFGYKLLEVETSKYILVNEIENHLPHLTFKASTQVLLFLVLVHIFMLSDTCKEEILWDFLRSLGIITHNSYQHEYFGDVKQLVTVDFVNQRYLEKSIIDKNDPSKFEYKWGCRAQNEISYRSALEFVAKIYGKSSLNNWKLQYKAMIAQERQQQ